MSLPLIAGIGSDLRDTQQMFFAFGFLSSAFAVGTAAVVSLLGIYFMTMVIAPNATQKFSGALREHNIKSFFAGLGTTVVMLVLLGLAHRSQPVMILLLTRF